MNNKILSFLLLVAALLFLGSAFMVFNGCAASNTASVEEGVVATTSTTAPLAPGETSTTTTTTTTAGDGGGGVVITSTTAAEIVVVPTTLPEEVPWIGSPTDPPTSTVKLCFIHHSVGMNWLHNLDVEPATAGGLGAALNTNHYYVTETDYDWFAGAENLGYLTDFGFWTTWFIPSNMAYVYSNNWHNAYDNTIDNPGGENEIVMFKSCFPNSNLFGSPTDAAASGASNVIEDQSTGDDAEQSTDYNVANAKWVYNQILAYCGTRTNKLFVVVTSPPRTAGHYVGSNAANARAFNNWLVNNWLDSYPHNNVVVFDFYNILTDPDNHHRYISGAVQHHTEADSLNTSYYPTLAGGGDDHPNSAGGRQATEDFVPLLNYYYHRWKGHVE